MFTEKLMSRSIRMVFAGGIAASLSLAAQAQTEEQQPIAKVEITGSSLKRVDSETALPVQVLTRAEIARTGATSTEQLLTMVTALSSMGSTNNATGAGTSTYGLSAISLRGLGSDRTLVLVNGRRLAAFAGGGGATVNVNVIPLAAIERVEVLKDGASGVYGSDAVAGVVNFILSKNFKGFEADASYGTPTTKGGAKNKKASATVGFGDREADGFSVVLSASHERESELMARDRAYSAKGDNPPYYTSGATGQGNIEGAIVGPYPADRGVGFGNSPGTGYGNPLADAGKCGDIQMYLGGKTTKGAPYCAFDSAPYVGLEPRRKLTNFTGNLSVKLGANAELFSDLLYSASDILQFYQGSPMRRSFSVSDAEFEKQGVEPALLLYPQNPAYQNIAVPYLTKYGFTSIIGQPLAITSRVFDFGGRQDLSEATQSRLVVGVRGSVAGQDYEVAMSSNRSNLHGSVPGGYFSQVEYTKILNDPASNWNPWAPGGVQTGALAERLKKAQYTGDTLNATSTSKLLDAKVTGDLPQVAGIAAQYALGFQSRHETYTTNPSPALEAGDVAGLGGSVPPVNRSRTINSVFGEANVPLMKGLDLGAAVRNDRYDDVGVSTNYKANVRYQPTRMLLLRASAGTGFRAPTLTDLWTPQTIGTSEAFDDPATGQTDLQVNSITGGNPNLKPERSRQFSAGLVVSPVDDLSIGVDYFRVKVTDILAQPSTQEVVSGFRKGDHAYAGLVTLSGNDIDTVKVIYTNTGMADVRGADVFAAYRLRTGMGRWDFGLNGTWMQKYDQTSPGGVLNHKIGTIVDADGNPVIGADDGGVVLRWKHALSATWSWEKVAVTLTQNYSTGYETSWRMDEKRNFISAQSLYDANLSWTGIKDLTVNFGVRNLFNKQPQVFIPVSNQFQSGYDITQYDPRGRFVYLSAGYKFR
jgi:iron complex outermembrane receptor protein